MLVNIINLRIMTHMVSNNAKPIGVRKMQVSQNQLEQLKDLMSKGMSAAQANVELVKIQRVHLCTSRVPADVRKALNAAVKSGELAHMKKDGSKPECYYHPKFEYMAKNERYSHECRVNMAMASVFGGGSI